MISLATASITQILKPMMNAIFSERQTGFLLPVGLAAFTAFALKGLAMHGQMKLVSRTGLEVVARLQRQLMQTFVRADVAFFDRTATGVLIARLINDINLLRDTVSASTIALGRDSLTAILLIAVMFYEDWQMALIAILTFPLAIRPVMRVSRQTRKFASHSQTQTGALTSLLLETFQGIRDIKAYGTELFAQARGETMIRKVCSLKQRSALAHAVIFPVTEFLAGTVILLVIIYGGHQVAQGMKDAGSFFAFLLAFMLAYEPIKRLAHVHTSLQEGLAAADRIFAALTVRPGIVDRVDAKTLKTQRAEIVFDGVGFSYPGNKHALRGVCLRIAAGKKTALVGLSGAGKTTVLSLIPRFYDPDEGRITINGEDLRAFSLSSLREHIGFVGQEVLLFDDTFQANIAYGSPDASMEEVEEAARHAGIHDKIVSTSMRYQTRVGPQGVQLSGGERQRVAIARAMLRGAPILLLDEATSSLDSKTEEQVQQALRRLSRGRTTLLIAHRLSSVTDADIIYVLEGGQVLGQGTHSELMREKGLYASLCAKQFKDFSVPPSAPLPPAS